MSTDAKLLQAIDYALEHGTLDDDSVENELFARSMVVPKRPFGGCVVTVTGQIFRLEVMLRDSEARVAALKADVRRGRDIIQDVRISGGELLVVLAAYKWSSGEDDLSVDLRKEGGA